jgi:small subunit ribosomal protein S2
MEAEPTEGAGTPEPRMSMADSVDVGMRELLEAGIHFGHQTTRWNPKMRPFIYGARNGIHIIDLQHTVRMFRLALRFVTDTVAAGLPVLFVGTKKQAQDIIQQEAARATQFFVNNRWLGGTLTNWRTIKSTIDRLLAIEKMRADGTFERLTKKEGLRLDREAKKLERNLSGIKAMPGLPGAIFVIDPKKEHIAVREARRLEIPVVAVADTNCDPDEIDYAIPGNDDAIRAIRIYCSKMADACLLGQQLGRERATTARQQKEQAGAEPETIRVSSGGDGPKVEMVSRRGALLDPEASSTPEE